MTLSMSLFTYIVLSPEAVHLGDLQSGVKNAQHDGNNIQ